MVKQVRLREVRQDRRTDGRTRRRTPLYLSLRQTYFVNRTNCRHIDVGSVNRSRDLVKKVCFISNNGWRGLRLTSLNNETINKSGFAGSRCFLLIPVIVFVIDIRCFSVRIVCVLLHYKQLDGNKLISYIFGIFTYHMKISMKEHKLCQIYIFQFKVSLQQL